MDRRSCRCTATEAFALLAENCHDLISTPGTAEGRSTDLGVTLHNANVMSVLKHTSESDFFRQKEKWRQEGMSGLRDSGTQGLRDSGTQGDT